MVGLCFDAPRGIARRASPDERVGTSRAPIAYGTADVKHTAVVSVLAPVGSDSCRSAAEHREGRERDRLRADRGALLQHVRPTLVVVASDYAIGENDLGGGTPSPPVYPVVPGSVFYDAQYTGNDHDFCLLAFAGATAGTATLALPASASDGWSSVRR